MSGIGKLLVFLLSRPLLQLGEQKVEFMTKAGCCFDKSLTNSPDFHAVFFYHAAMSAETEVRKVIPKYLMVIQPSSKQLETVKMQGRSDPSTSS